MKALALAVVPTFLLACIMALTGCSSTPKVVAQKPQYCYTSQTIKTTNREEVNSETTVECTDDQIKRVTANRLGLASNCGYYTGWMKKGNQDVQYKGISCQRPDGSWELIR